MTLSGFDALIDQGVVRMGAHSYGEPQVLLWRRSDGSRLGGDVEIGRYCSIAEGVVIMTGGNHRTDWITTSPLRVLWDLPERCTDGHPASKGDVRIGNDVWIGRDAFVLSGVTIGDGAVVGARAVVTRNVRPYAIVAGNPARETRRRFAPNEIDQLVRIRWWDWSDEKVRAELDLLLSDGIAEFLSRHRWEPECIARTSPLFRWTNRRRR